MYSFTRKLDGLTCARIRELFATTVYTGIKVSTEMPQNIPTRMIWVKMESGNVSSQGEQNILFRFRILGTNIDEAEDIAFTLRSFLDDDENIFLLPITYIETSSPAATNLLEQMEKQVFYFTATFHELAHQI